MIMRVCPSCQQTFSRSKGIKGVKGSKTCPECGVEIVYGTGRMNGQVLLKVDKESVHVAVQMVVAHIDRRDKTRFEMGVSEYSGQVAAAYGLLDKCKGLLNNSDYALPDVTAGDFLIRMFENVLADDYWRDNIKSVYQVTSQARKFATMTHGQYKKELEARTINRRSIVNDGDFAPVEGVTMCHLVPTIM